VADTEETVLAEVLVVTRLSIGLERLRLFLTDRRIIVAHVGKRGAGSLGMVSFFGRLSGAIEDIIKSGRESVGKRKLGKSTPDEILAMDKDNFFVNYTDVVDVSVDTVLARPRLTVLTKDEKLQFTVQSAPEDLPELLHRVLAGKVRENSD